jgi:hypothetical protein
MAASLSPEALSALSLAFGTSGAGQAAAQQLISSVNSSFRNIPQASPPVAAAGSNAGSGATVAYVNGTNATDNAGQLVVTTGTGAAPGQVASVTYMAPLAIAPVVNLMPANAAAAAPAYGTYVSPITSGGMYTGFTVNTVGTPASSTAHNWNYTVLPGL